MAYESLSTSRARQQLHKAIAGSVLGKQRMPLVQLLLQPLLLLLLLREDHVSIVRARADKLAAYRRHGARQGRVGRRVGQHSSKQPDPPSSPADYERDEPSSSSPADPPSVRDR